MGGSALLSEPPSRTARGRLLVHSWCIITPRYGRHSFQQVTGLSGYNRILQSGWLKRRKRVSRSGEGCMPNNEAPGNLISGENLLLGWQTTATLHGRLAKSREKANKVLSRPSAPSRGFLLRANCLSKTPALSSAPLGLEFQHPHLGEQRGPAVPKAVKFYLFSSLSRSFGLRKLQACVSRRDVLALGT